MIPSTVLTIGLALGALGAISPKNFILIIPDGFAPASQTLARTYVSLDEGGSPQSLSIKPLPVDMTPIGNIFTHSENDLVTDSAAAGTALATGHKTNNGMIGKLPNGAHVGSILEAAKLEGFKTALVVTSIINHATPAAFSAHTSSRDKLDKIAAQQIGYRHPLNQSVDILLGGGRCYFWPDSDPRSCRGDHLDLFSYAESQGYYIAQNRSAFDYMRRGLGSTGLPYLGLFNDRHMSYEVDRIEQPENEREPSLSEMARTALNSLDRATEDEEKGYFIMIEASRIDHASHAHDINAHLGEVLEYNKVVDLVVKWINEHPDTAMISVADHECGGLTLPAGYDPRHLQTARHSIKYLSKLWEDEHSKKGTPYLIKAFLPTYGLDNVSQAEAEDLRHGDFGFNLAELLSQRVGVAWSTGGHTAVDTTLYAYAAGKMGEQLKADLAGARDNTEIPRYIQKALGISMDAVTDQLREVYPAPR